MTGLGLAALASTLVVVLLFSKHAFGTWFSPMGVYFGVWTTLLSLYILRLITYDPITATMWWVIAVSFLGFSTGSITPVLARFSQQAVRNRVCSGLSTGPSSQKRLRILILLLCVPSALAVAGQWAILLSQGGSIGAVLGRAGVLREAFVQGELELGVLEYLSIFAYAASILGGGYLALVSVSHVTPYLPMFFIVAFSVPITARLSIIWGLALYLSAFLLTRLATGGFRITGKRIVAAAALAMATLLAMNLLWEARMGGEYKLLERYASPSFVAARDALLATTGPVGSALMGNSISLYAYATNPFAKLNAVVSRVPLQADAPRPGTVTFAAFFRLLAKTGIVHGEFTGQLEAWLVPVPAKPGTYLSTVFYDFGWIGIAIIPYLFGICGTYLYMRYMRKPDYTTLGILCVLYLAILYSWHNSLFVHTVPLGVLLVWLPTGSVLDRSWGFLLK